MNYKRLIFVFFGTVLVTLPLIIFSGCSEGQTKKYIGLQLYSVRDTIKNDVDGVVKAVGDMGYKFVETAGYKDGQFYGMDPLEFKGLVEENGMDFLSSHTGRSLPDSTNWEETMQWWDECVQAHHKAGVKYIVQPWMGKEGYTDLAGLKQYCEYFEKVGEKCNAKGIRFGYHNHSEEFKELEGVTIYDYMLQNTDPSKVFFQMDLYWVHVGGADPVEYFEEYPGRFELWHVKDKAEVGASGNMDFKKIFENRQNSGVKYYIVEVEEYNFEPLVSVEKSLEYLNNADFVQ